MIGAKRRITMSQTKPIKNWDEMQAFKNYYLIKHKNLRNYTLIVLGLNTALRISDLLRIQWGDVYNFKKGIFRKHLEVRETKTGKRNCIALNHNVVSALKLYQETLSDISDDTYVFPSRKNKLYHLSRYQAYRIVKEAADAAEIDEVIGCHSMRKTFGYQASKQGVPPALLMSIYNHSSYQITKRYLDIDQDDKDEAFTKINL